MAFLGTILLPGYLGAAVAAQVRAEDPWFVFQPYRVVGVGRLFLRDGRIRVLVSK